MFSRKKNEESGRKGRRSNDSHKQLLSMGLVPGDDSDGEDEAALEAELQNLMYGGSKATKPKKRKAAPGPPEPDLDRMVAECMADIPDDIEDSEDLDDTDLLDQLAEFEEDVEEVPIQPAPTRHAPPPVVLPTTSASCQPEQCAGQSLLSVIDTRLEQYTAAERKSKEAGETSRARRFGRGLTTLKELKRKITNGKPVDENDIPPALAMGALSSSSNDDQPSPPEPAVYSPPVVQAEVPRNPEARIALEPQRTVNPVLENLQEKRSAYKDFALGAKKNGDKSAAMLGLSGVKQCDEMIESVQKGQPIDLNSLPDLSAPSRQPQPPPPPTVTPPRNVERSFSRDDPIQMPDNPEDIPPANPEVFGAPPAPKSAEEALQQRLAKYRQDESKAKAEGNSSRARRLGRICKQYKEAIGLHKKGKLAMVVADLPCPPGFGPIPLAEATQPSAASSAEPGAVKRPAPQPAAPVGSKATAPTATAKKPLTLQEKQLQELQKRQNQFKAAALTAKKAGQIEQAKEYLRKAKGFDSLIDAAKSGLPVDFKTLPVPPQAVKGKTDIQIVIF